MYVNGPKSNLLKLPINEFECWVFYILLLSVVTDVVVADVFVIGLVD